MITIESMSELQTLLLTGFTDWDRCGNVRAVYKDDLVLFNYKGIIKMQWNWFERVSRGLILNRNTGEVVARPFDKFWNWGEDGKRPGKGAHLVNITEKLDGSLGILYRRYDDEFGYYSIATRGSFDGPQAQWATAEIRSRNLDYLDPALTLLFEIIYRDNRIVVDYGSFEGLVLLAARNRHTGQYLPFFPGIVHLAHEYGFVTPTVYRFNSVTDILEKCEKLPSDQEGFVAEFSDGSRFKFKGDRYKELHRLVTGDSVKRVIRMMQAGTLDQVPEGFPIHERAAFVRARVEEIKHQVELTFAAAPRNGTRKEFALWVKEHHPDLAPYLFARLDDKDYEHIIYKKGF